MFERVRFGGFSGSYRITNAELARDRKTKTINVSVLFLDDSSKTFQIEVIRRILLAWFASYLIFFSLLEKGQRLRTVRTCFPTLGTIRKRLFWTSISWCSCKFHFRTEIANISCVLVAQLTSSFCISSVFVQNL